MSDPQPNAADKEVQAGGDLSPTPRTSHIDTTAPVHKDVQKTPMRHAPSTITPAGGGTRWLYFALSVLLTGLGGWLWWSQEVALLANLGAVVGLAGSSASLVALWIATRTSAPAPRRAVTIGGGVNNSAIISEEGETARDVHVHVGQDVVDSDIELK